MSNVSGCSTVDGDIKGEDTGGGGIGVASVICNVD